MSTQLATLEMFRNLLQLAVENGASDIHIKSGKPAYLRLNGHLEPIEMDPLTQDEIINFIEATVPAQVISGWLKDGQVDYCYSLDDIGLGRFRINGFNQRGTPSIVIRHVKDSPPSFEDLQHDAASLKKLCNFKDGILLICGPTGCGKSSTLAAMLNYINHTYDKHIVTLEDPIEYNYTDDLCIFSQREVGIDAASFELGLKAVLRQDPDIILIGEMRDQETFKTALRAAETGHFVLGTLHSSNVRQAIQRLFEFFEGEEQHHMRRQIASTLRAIVAQSLIPCQKKGVGRVPAVEMLVVDAVSADIIEKGDYFKIPQLLESYTETGSKSFNMDLQRLIENGLISKQDALTFSPNPKALEMNLKGIYLSKGGIVK
ncbi:MAG: twitching motility protein [Verrucomicrobia bacterium CG_4_10_14_3_um_filter_43_23]|nr:MAG: twitching motility protein [Verrucomicrobia bacterium CG1_02_43_26]PIP59323.1 MAG: twitching motility protein [Verrucomicrobia bacterium CG22_combo_CG10-13_8_21_14_all_43_17]PIX58509.1 MAG: twitching motility protein [Verrucomicrobia bacterium CG_4_10_14_3_um_filter_43_23]PIY62702.1 MAG: twitching motility protein [Verrucomicrobia bacterium CG_4_10_14_0_8_um_filter_43_34]PJA43662.1 MAG: twitching motility protein [Verrucomicrobia bacterium CG_4_9_14_3_um_filter_43_20]